MRIATLTLAFFALLSTALLAQEKPQPAPASIQLRLEIPAAKNGEKQVLRGVLKNLSQETIEVPAEYEGYAIQLYASTELTRWPMSLRRREKLKDMPVKVAPGEERVLFRFPIGEMIDGRFDTGKPGNDYGWDWAARPAPPPSPFRSRDAVAAREATFWLQFRLDKQSASSKRLRVKWEQVFTAEEEK